MSSLEVVSRRYLVVMKQRTDCENLCGDDTACLTGLQFTPSKCHGFSYNMCTSALYPGSENEG